MFGYKECDFGLARDCVGEAGVVGFDAEDAVDDRGGDFGFVAFPHVSTVDVICEERRRKRRM